MFILMSIVYEVINIATLNLTENIYVRLFHIPAKDEITLTFIPLISSYISFWLIAINLHFSDILNFIYQWLGNC